MELADTKKVLYSPMHPYTWALLSSNPGLIPKHKPKRIILKGEIPNPINPPSGCRFHPRCPFVKDICKKEESPPLAEVKKGHFVRCYFPYLAQKEWMPFLKEK